MNNLNTFSVTTNFIAPMVFKDNVKFTNITTTIYNTYLSIFDKPEFDDKIILEVKSNIDLKLCRPNIYHKTYNGLYIFNIPKEFEDDLYLVIGGKYSQLSEEYKRKLLYFWDKDKDSLLFSILYKVKSKRFTENEYLLNHHKIDIVNEYYIKPLYTELIYGLLI